MTDVNIQPPAQGIDYEDLARRAAAKKANGNQFMTYEQLMSEARKYSDAGDIEKAKQLGQLALDTRNGKARVALDGQGGNSSNELSAPADGATGTEFFLKSKAPAAPYTRLRRKQPNKRRLASICVASPIVRLMTPSKTVRQSAHRRLLPLISMW